MAIILSIKGMSVYYNIKSLGLFVLLIFFFTYIPQVNFPNVEKVEWLNKVCHSIHCYEICVYCL